MRSVYRLQIDFRFDHFIVINNISIGQKFAVDKMNMAKTAVSHSGSEARAHLAHA